MSKTYSAGIVTAYGAAKRAGYQGTYEDFCRQQAGYAGNAAAVEAAKTATQNAASTATTKATEATTAATAAQTAKAQTEQIASQALTDISTARSGAISAVHTEGQTQTAEARAQAQAAEASATTASTKASEASASATSAGQSATNAAASATSAAQSASNAQDVLESIPADYSALSANVSQLRADLGELQEGGYVADAQQIQSKVNTWLVQHPEATTTVQDGSLTEAKFSNALKLKTIKDYVTPEMFGAVGDGVSDDTIALQEAVDSGKTVFGYNSYLVTSPIIIGGEKRTIHFYGQIKSESSSVIKFENAWNCDFYFNEVRTTSGKCIIFHASGTSYNQYNRLKFNYLRASEECILFETSNGRWCNENTIIGGRCVYGTWAIYADDSSNTSVAYSCIEGNSFEHIGIEGTTYGIYLGRADNTVIVLPRYAEAPHFITTVGRCHNLLIITKNNVTLRKFIFSNDTIGTIVGGALTGNILDYSTSANIAFIKGGRITSTGHDFYLNITGASIDENGVADLTNRAFAECPTCINVNFSCNTVILPNLYGNISGINRLILMLNETQSRAVTIKKENNIIAIFGNEIPNYSKIKFEWDAQVGWTYSIVTMARTS